MRLANVLPVFTALVLGGVLSLATALVAANIVEKRAREDVTRILGLNGQDWVQVEADGLQITLTGTAPDEATRFRALSLAGTVVDSSRVNDMMEVAESAGLTPPRFSVEILRNDAGISLIGLIPAGMDRETVISSLGDITGGTEVTDLLDVADYPAPEGWDTALSYGLGALAELPKSKISISAGRVEVIAISGSAEEKRRLEADLTGRAPPSLDVTLEISAPRPVITPYTLRFLIDEDGARFDACTTDTEEGRERILAAARAAGLTGEAGCTIGLGAPSPRWDEAVVAAIGRLAELGGGTLTFVDADITLVAPPGTPQETFDRAIGRLEAELPEAFSLNASIAPPPETGQRASDGPPEFIATRSPEGLVQLRGRIPDERTRRAIESFARARFGSAMVDGAMRLDETLPRGWPVRVLASLDALALLRNGAVVMRPDFLEIKGVTGNPDTKAQITRLLSEKLGESEHYRISVSYREALDPVAALPTPEECVERINAVIRERKITFAPGSAEIDREARQTIDKIAEIMKDCTEVPMEVAGHTDSQGRESMNLGLSQSRAEAVVNALLARRVLTSNLRARGYGESQPIADNSTEEGREANRRIEFRLIGPEEEEPPVPTGADAAEAPHEGTPHEEPPATGQPPATTPQAEHVDEQN